MYDLRYTDSRLSGNVYRSTHRCGKTTCRCAVSKHDGHPAYYLEYHERVKGQWKRKREYIPRAKVKALRQRIRRAKVRDREQRAQRRFFLTKAHRIAKRLKDDPTALWDVVGLLQTPVPPPANELERAQMVAAWVQLSLSLSQQR